MRNLIKTEAELSLKNTLKPIIAIREMRNFNTMGNTAYFAVTKIEQHKNSTGFTGYRISKPLYLKLKQDKTYPLLVEKWGR